MKHIGEQHTYLQDPIALKIYTDSTAFENERRAFEITSVARAISTAPTFMKNDDGVALMPSGQPFPPFIVTEQARSLEVWLQSYSADLITSLQVHTSPIAEVVHVCTTVFKMISGKTSR